MYGVRVVGWVLASMVASSAQAADAQSIATSVAEFNQWARYPLPTLDEGQLDKLAAGKLVRIRQDVGGNTRIIGLAVHNETRERLFLATSDPHANVVEEVTEALLTPPDAEPLVWYQYLDLPRPFADRHWVVDVANNREMASNTQDRAWEHWWSLSHDGLKKGTTAVSAGRAPGITAGMAAKAVYVDVNTGAYLYITLPTGETLYGFHATSVVGGNIPNYLVSEYAFRTLSRVVMGVMGRIDRMVAHYDAAHAASDPVLGGDGTPLQPHGVRR